MISKNLGSVLEDHRLVIASAGGLGFGICVAHMASLLLGASDCEHQLMKAHGRISVKDYYDCAAGGGGTGDWKVA